MASAWGARSASARKPASGRGMRGIRSIPNRRFNENLLFENPILRSCAQLLESFFAARLAVHANHRFRPRQAVTDPRSVVQYQLQAVFADHFANFMSEELVRIGLQLLSELCLDLRRQSEVLPLRKERTNLVTDVLQLFSQGLAPIRHRLAAEQPGEHAVF